MQNAVNKNKAILIAVAIILTALFVSVSVCGSGVTYADSENITTYRQVVFNRSYRVASDGSLSFPSWKQELRDIECDYVEYVIEYHYSTYVGASTSDETYGTYIYSSDYSFNLMFGSRQGPSYEDTEKYFAFGEYGENGYPFEYSVMEGSANDFVYFTMTTERAFLSYFPDDGSSVGNATYYEESLNHILFEFDIESDEYSYLRSLGDVPLNGDYDIYKASLIETLNCYKDMEVPVKEGYTFIGWFYDEEFTRPYNGEAIESDVKLYAKYEINRYTVTFDGSELDDSSDPNNVGLHNKVDEVEYGTVIDYVPEYVEGKVFDGWYYEDGTKYDNEPIKSDVVLIGHWRQAKCTITFDLEDKAAELEALEAMEVEYGSIVELPIPTLGEYRVWYWEDVSNPAWNVNEPVTSDLHLIATWEKYIFTVTFYIDSEIYKEVKVEKGKTLGSVALTENIDSKSVVGFENLNSVTVAAEFVKFEVDDDVAVYLSEDIAIDDVPVDNKADMTLWQKFVAQVKAFFEKIGQWFKNLFGKNKS